jgi:hypothetical protein
MPSVSSVKQARAEKAAKIASSNISSASTIAVEDLAIPETKAQNLPNINSPAPAAPVIPAQKAPSPLPAQPEIDYNLIAQKVVSSMPAPPPAPVIVAPAPVAPVVIDYNAIINGVVAALPSMSLPSAPIFKDKFTEKSAELKSKIDIAKIIKAIDPKNIKRIETIAKDFDLVFKLKSQIKTIKCSQDSFMDHQDRYDPNNIPKKDTKLKTYIKDSSEQIGSTIDILDSLKDNLNKTLETLLKGLGSNLYQSAKDINEIHKNFYEQVKTDPTIKTTAEEYCDSYHNEKLYGDDELMLTSICSLTMLGEDYFK